MSLQDHFTRNLKEGEQLVRIVRPFALVYAVPLGLTAMVLLGDFFLLYWFVHHGRWGIAAFVVILVVGALLASRTAYLWTRNVFLITNQRVIDIDQRGFFDRSVSESSYEKIQDVSFTVRGVFATFFRYGTVSLQTAGSTNRIEIRHVRQPERVQELIVETQRVARQAPAPEEVPDLTSLVQTLRSQLGDEELRALLDRLRENPGDRDGRAAPR